MSGELDLVGTPGGVGQGGLDVVLLDVRVFAKDLIDAVAGAEQARDGADRDARDAQTGPPITAGS